MSTGKVVLGTLAGLAIGAIAGILFAPEKGSKTRKQIMDKGDDLVDDLRSKFDNFFDSVSEKLDQTRRGTEELVESGKTKYDDVKKGLNNAASEMKRTLS